MTSGTKILIALMLFGAVAVIFAWLSWGERKQYGGRRGRIRMAVMLEDATAKIEVANIGTGHVFPDRGHVADVVKRVVAAGQEETATTSWTRVHRFQHEEPESTLAVGATWEKTIELDRRPGRVLQVRLLYRRPDADPIALVSRDLPLW